MNTRSDLHDALTTIKASLEGAGASNQSRGLSSLANTLDSVLPLKVYFSSKCFESFAMPMSVGSHPAQGIER